MEDASMTVPLPMFLFKLFARFIGTLMIAKCALVLSLAMMQEGVLVILSIGHLNVAVRGESRAYLSIALVSFRLI